MDASDPGDDGENRCDGKDEGAEDGRDGESVVRGYYDAIDAGDYERLASLLSPAFVHDRPDRTLSDRASFVSFMREDRPEKDTRHDVTAVYRAVGDETGETERWAARGRLVGADRRVRFEFVDAFTLADDGLRRLETFAREA